jgi:carboxymethylenebutenolidase
MGTKIELTATDGHKFDAYLAESSDPARGAIVLVQEIFGVNSHIRSVADDYAAQGFHVIAPALFDRVQRNLELNYNPTDSTEGMKAARQIGMDAALLDVAASIGHARPEWGRLKVGVLGFCYGGSLAWLAATRLDPAAAVCYYGGQIAASASETKIPTLVPQRLKRSRQLILTCRCFSMTRDMASIAISARTSSRSRQGWRGNARLNSLAVICDLRDTGVC